MQTQPQLDFTLAGAAGGLASCLVTQPLELLKTRAQLRDTTRGGARYTFMGHVRHILATEGVRGFYKGLLPMICALVPSWATYFPVYSTMKPLWAEWLSCADTQPRVHILSALCAGSFTACTTNPLWVVKTRMQSEGYSRKVFETLRDLVHRDGIPGLFKGLSASLIGTTHAGIQFPVYEKLKHVIAEYEGRDKPDAPGLLVASSCSKLMATSVTYPHQVLRSHLHMTGITGDTSSIRDYGFENKKPGLVELARRITRRYGWRGFYRGMLANMMQVVPSCAVTFTTFELVLRWLHTMRFPEETGCVCYAVNR